MFYALLPLLARALAWRARASPGRAAARLIALGLLSLLFRFWVTKWSSAPLPWRYSLPATFLFFVPGMLVALLRCRWDGFHTSGLRALAFHSEVWLLAAVALWLITCLDYDLLPLLTLSSGLMVGGCVLPLRRGVSVGVLEWRWLAAIGVASYSLYLWHVPVISLITGTDVPGYGASGLLVRVLPLALAVALLSYRLIEVPFLRLRRRWSDP
jgi:peptidoglycan/LPS O-acetylase OafA/YrhL